MSLPFELTTLPQYAVDIIRYLAQQDSYEAYDSAIIEALDISERAFGKAIRRLVTREYVEMQYEGPYVLTERGMEAAEAIQAHDEETQYDAGFDEEDAIDLDAEETAEPQTRGVIAVYPKMLPASQPAYLFLRVDAPALEGDPLPETVSLTLRLSGDCEIDPVEQDVAVPADGASHAARFAVTAPEGKHKITVEAFQVAGHDLLEAGKFSMALHAEEGAATGVFLSEAFEVQLHSGV